MAKFILTVACLPLLLLFPCSICG